MDKLFNRAEERGIVCIRLDIVLEYIPSYLFEGRSEVEALVEFNKQVIDATIGVATCFKVQIVYYEALGLKGTITYKETLDYLREKDAIVTADIKRGDVAATAKQYAKAHFEGNFEADFIALSPHMGMSSIEPYMPYMEKGNKGLSLLVGTSNPGAEDIEMPKTINSRGVYKVVGDKIVELGKRIVGEYGYSGIGGVIGCTYIEEGIEIRKRFKNIFFLISGYRAQGGRAKDVALYLNNGNGGVVNSSRAILLACKKREGMEKEFALCMREEVIRIRDEIGAAVKNL